MATISAFLGFKKASALSVADYEILRTELTKEIQSNPHIQKILEERVNETVPHLQSLKGTK